MKKILFFLVFSSSIIIGQNKIENDILYTKIENSMGIEVPIKMTISKETQSKIKQTEEYKEFATNNKKPNILANKIYIDLSFITMWLKLKVSNGFDFVPNSKGNIYYSDNNELNYVVPFKTSNGEQHKAIKTSKGVDIL